MKGKELQRIVESKLREGKTPKEIVNDLGPEHISLRTVKYWSTMLKQKGHLRLQKPPGRPRTVRTAALTRTIKKKSKRKKPVSIRKLGRETTTPKSTVHRVLKEDLKVKAFKKRKVPKLTPEQKTKRVHFARWVLRTLLSNERKRVVFSDEKYFDLDGMYNAQNDRVWAATREEADKQGGQFRKSKFPVKIMVYMAAAATGAVKLHISKAPTLNADIYTKECLPLAKILGHKEFGIAVGGINRTTLHLILRQPHSSGVLLTFQISLPRSNGLPTAQTSTPWTTASGWNWVPALIGTKCTIKKH